MFAALPSVAFQGLSGIGVRVEVDIGRGLPRFAIVGLGDTAVQEARERVRSSIRNSGFVFPQQRIVVNLAPAHTPKYSSLYDVPIALAILVASGQLVPAVHPLCMGELALTGAIRSVPGVANGLHFAEKHASHAILFPSSSLEQCAFGETSVTCFSVSSLKEAADVLAGRGAPTKLPERRFTEETHCRFSLEGQEAAKRAALIAAVGGHNLLLSGPPGSGKTMLAKDMAGLLGELSDAVYRELSLIYSLLRESFHGCPPFRQVHHSASRTALVGGGTWMRPGEVTMAHGGILFLDELPEFRREVLELLREPMEEGYIRLSRARGSVTYPAACQVVAAQNPCPCGYAGSEDVECSCSFREKERYRQRLSGPLLDRFDMFVSMRRVSLTDSHDTKDSEGYGGILSRARELSIAREQHKQNRFLSKGELETDMYVLPEVLELARSYGERHKLSMRGYVRLLRVSRSIADLACSQRIQKAHLLEALMYRRAW